MAEKVKTVIEFYFLLPDFKSCGHPRYGEKAQKAIEGDFYSINWATVGLYDSNTANDSLRNLIMMN